jgi:YVTN family beta-propeller protein
MKKKRRSSISVVTLYVVYLLLGTFVSVSLAHNKKGNQKEYKYLYAPLGPFNKVVKIDLKTETVVNYFDVGVNPHGITVSPDGRYIYTGQMRKMKTNQVLVTDILTKKKIEIPVGKIIHHFDISKDGNYIYVTAEKLVIINTRTMKVVAQVKTGMMPYYVSVGPNEKYIYVTNKGSNTLSILSFPLGKIVSTISTGPGPSHIAFSPDGRRLYITETGGETVSVIDLKKQALVKSIKVGKDAHAIDVTPEGIIFMSNRGDNSVYMIDPSSLKIKKKIAIPVPDHIAVGPEGKKVYIGSRTEKAIYVLDAVTGKILKKIPVKGEPHQLVFSK